MKKNVPMPAQGTEADWFETEEPLVGFASKISKEEKMRKQASKAARFKAEREAKKYLEVEVSEKQYPRGKFYTLSSDTENFESGQLVLIVSPLLANCPRNNLNKKVDVLVVCSLSNSIWRYS